MLPAKAARLLRRLGRERKGATAVVFALLAVPLSAAIVGAIDIGSAVAQRVQIQDSLDSAALASVKLLADPTKTSSDVTTAARNMLAPLAASYPGVASSQVTVDTSAKTVAISYSGSAYNLLTGPLIGGVVTVNAKAKAALNGTAQYPVCILITEPKNGHTLRASNGAKVDLNNCLVQVNTANWDAVEAADTSYIHINNGQNCYVGDIHFGDITPAKMPTCDLFPDPYASLSPGVPSGCDYTNYSTATAGLTLSPGVYCGNVKITKDATFSPGIYYITGGTLQISGTGTDVTANGVAFVLSGNKAGFTVNTTGTFKITPPNTGSKFDGFIFYLDQSAATNPNAQSSLQSVQMTASGIIYLAGQQLVTSGSATKVVINPGAIVADYLLPQGGTFNFTGSTSSSVAAQSMAKSISNASPILVE